MNAQRINNPQSLLHLVEDGLLHSCTQDRMTEMRELSFPHEKRTTLVKETE